MVDGTEPTCGRRIFSSATSDDPSGLELVQLSQDKQQTITQIWKNHMDAIVPGFSEFDEFDRLEWAKQNIHVLGSSAAEAGDFGLLIEDLSIQVSDPGPSLQIHQTVLSAFICPFMSIWNRLCNKQSYRRQTSILHNFNGIICSGELLLVLGRPGSGCSTLLKAMSGYKDGMSLDSASKIQYKGISFASITKKYNGDAAYNQEEDHHFPHLTVDQTLQFAAYSRAPSIGLGNMSRDEYVKMMVEVVMTLFGLHHTRNTRVGDDYVRGLSGGERKRVSIAEMILARAPICAWDNSTRGLDSNSAFDFVQALRLSADLTKTSHAAALYQASEPIYNTFDNVTILYEGRQVYFGPCQHAVGYFERMGWKRHSHQVSTDFLTAITNPMERVPKDGMADQVPNSAEDFEVYWKQSSEYARLSEKMREYAKRLPPDDREESKLNCTKYIEAKSVQLASPFILPLASQLRLCLIRAYRRSLNDRAGIIATAVVQIFLAILIGSLFYNISETSDGLSSRASVIFLAVLTNNLIALLEINVLYSQRPIVQKHSRYAFVRPFTDALAGAIIDLPIKLVRCLIASVIIYFMAHLRRSPGHFFIYILFQLISVITMSGLFRCLATITRTMNQAMALGGIIIICIAVYTGFTIPQQDMRPWLGWIRWLNPIFYTFEGIVANEFHGLRFKCVQYVPDYRTLSGLSFTCLEVGAVAGEHYVSGDRYIEKHYAYSYIHLWRNFGILVSFLVSFHILYLTLTELVPGTVSAPKKLTFLPSDTTSYFRQDDIEAGQGLRISKKLSSNTYTRPLLPLQKNEFTWKGLSYDIQVKEGTKRLLDDVNGWVKSGTLTALMGLSGAGKTTLLDVLSQRMTCGVVTGEILVNAQGLNPSICRKTGYVEQNDLHCETSTIREALRFSAVLRQPRSVPVEEKYAFVEEVIQMLGMDDFAEAVIGNPGEGLNIEQRKLLTIGVELAAKPEVLIFLDEPTSGLDAQSSFAICAFMRKLADHGQAVLATIHQPSVAMFEQFDNLLLLAKGGKPVYFGEIGAHFRTLLNYLESNGARSCGAIENPAEYMLEVISEGSQGGSQFIDWVDFWKKSPQNQQVLDHLHSISVNPSQQSLTIDKPNKLEFAMPITAQLYQVMKRDFQQYYRQPEYIMAKLALGAVSGLFVGFSFWKSDNSTQGFQNTLFSLFLLCTVFSTLVNQIMPKFMGKRAIYELRERPSRTYSWKVFIFSQIVVELPWQALLATLTWVSFYFSVYGGNQDPQRQGLVFLFVLQFFFFASSFAHLIASAVPNPVLGSMLALFMFVMSLLSNGIMQPPNALPPFWNYMHKVSPLTYYVGGISATALHGRPINCSDREVVSFDAPSGQTCGQYLRQYLELAPGKLLNLNSTGQCVYCPLRSADQYLASHDIFWDRRWTHYGILWAYVVFNICGAILFYYCFRVLPYSRANKAK